ncbi:Putative N-acetylglucosaminyltransferase I [Klebsormidium nitens]|uniref:Alpha-1,3-mannosyl-glycoprotein 2-beta-N-acetylglucosaminyltransferase n=1 Tax=Klebsormidium nitens TaxID=105231 RepID=A0A1Y1HPG7_KLENI|nr:Putative N-acetylglucosaminyltransferase I [Klebsormidium nitens]|eukprot:GAQ79099.1 Putative N-acetylglucosaminyltransferase I [Klebsormidium nitens]
MARTVTYVQFALALALFMFALVQFELWNLKSSNVGQASVGRKLKAQIRLPDSKLTPEPNKLKALEKEAPIAAVVVVACNRPDYLERTIQGILKFHTSSSKFPLFISQDGTNAEVKAVAQKYAHFEHFQHIESQPPQMEAGHPQSWLSYYRIADHYKYVFTRIFEERKFQRIIILEDDMEVAVDFFDYFEALAPILDRDESLYAVSSWNDNGQKQFVHDPEAVYRSDFFPGLGWMMPRRMWAELGPKWPKAFWDDWMRLKDVRNGRQTIFPEICRNYNFGEHGSSLGQYFEQYLRPIRLNTEPVDWSQKDLTYLERDRYPAFFERLTSAATVIPADRAGAAAAAEAGDVLVEYDGESEPAFKDVARHFGIFEDWKDGVPRTAFQGAVTFRLGGPRRVIIAPRKSS